MKEYKYVSIGFTIFVAGLLAGVVVTSKFSRNQAKGPQGIVIPRCPECGTEATFAHILPSGEEDNVLWKDIAFRLICANEHRYKTAYSIQSQSFGPVSVYDKRSSWQRRVDEKLQRLQEQLNTKMDDYTTSGWLTFTEDYDSSVFVQDSPVTYPYRFTVGDTSTQTSIKLDEDGNWYFYPPDSPVTTQVMIRMTPDTHFHVTGDGWFISKSLEELRKDAPELFK